MNKTTKINLLYKKAHGQPLSKDEERELFKYKVDSDDGQIATRNNIAAYVDAVDQGC